MRKSDPSGLVAWTGATVGVFLMLAGVFYSLEDGPNPRFWEERRLAKRLFFSGAATAMVVPVVAFLVGLRKRRAPGKKPMPWDDLA